MKRQDIIDYIIGLGWELIRSGWAPGYMYRFVKDSLDITLYLHSIPCLLEIGNEEGYLFNGHFYTIEDLEKIIFLTLGCIDENGYAFNKQDFVE